MASAFQIDDILQDLSREQLLKLCELQAKVDHLQQLPSFSADVLNDPANQRTANKLADGTDSPFTWDLGVVRSKNFQKSVGAMTPKEMHDGMWRNVKHDDPDTLMVRHLRARHWDADKALCMMLGSVRWRNENDIQGTLLGGGDERMAKLAAGEGEHEHEHEHEHADAALAPEVMAQLRSGKSFTHGTDRSGRPLLFIRVQKHNPSAQTLQGLEKYIVLQTETARMILRAPMSSVTTIFDLGGFSMANMDWNAIKLLTLGLEDKYPESVGALYVYRAPWIVNGIWSVVKNMMPGDEAKKVKFVSNATQLSEHVDLKYLPADMGGTGSFEFAYVEPVAGENEAALKDTARRDEIQRERDALIEAYEHATREWAERLVVEEYRDDTEAGRASLESHIAAADVAEERAQRTAGAAGGGAGAGTADEAMARRRELVTKLRRNYWELDPYVRGRTHLDRVGVVTAGGGYNPEAGGKK